MTMVIIVIQLVTFLNTFDLSIRVFYHKKFQKPGGTTDLLFI